MKNHTTKLIEGNFFQQNAKTVLLNLLSDKINYHQMQKFSNEERFGEDRDHSAQRILELKKEKQELTDWLNTFANTDTIYILCNIEMQIINHGNEIF